ncbi:PIG-L family deacetylase [Marivirga tractuosa]|uniref:PIG-L deacetylase family protein n=1 Tax=Marivirga tractuosa TaxID=1006 RepID=UPI0035CF7C5B
MKNKYLIISPHLDDAVLSCGASMAQWQEKGADVIVASVFSSCADSRLELKEIYETRKKQDIEALTFLGAKAIHLGFTDAPFRSSRSYYNFSTILFHHEDEERILEQSIATEISKIIKEYTPDSILFPLGVGGHIDHHLVYRSSFKLDYPTEKIQFYEDLPYALVPGWTEVRLHKMDYKHELRPFSDFQGHLLDLKLPFLHNYTMDEDDKKASNLQYQKEIKYLTTVKKNTKGRLILDKIYLSKHFFEKKCEAILHYKTEWPILFGESENIKKVLHPNTEKHYTESFWKKK